MPDSNSRHNPSPFRIVRLSAVLLVGAACFGQGEAALAQKGYNDAAVQAAIHKAVTYLKKDKSQGAGGYSSLAAYALMKSDVPATAVQPALNQIVKRVKKGVYEPGSNHIYEAGVDLMALEAADPKRYAGEIKAIVDYLLAKQMEDGQWAYPDERFDGGDTSITQYAVLGLWAATRAGVEVPVERWERTAKWLMNTQRSNGGYIYHPTPTKPDDPNIPREIRHSMTVAGAGSLFIVRRMLFPEAKELTKRKPPKPVDIEKKKRIRIKSRYLIPIDIDDESPDEPLPIPDKQGPESKAGVKLVDIDEHLQKSLDWMTNNFSVANPKGWPIYYLYGLERLSALADVDAYGSTSWYESGAMYLVGAQKPDGSWEGMIPIAKQFPAVAHTSLALLFLKKSTAKTIGRTPRRVRMGTGLLAGGRGLPDNLEDIEMKNGELKVKKSHLPVENLLADLERLDFSDVDTAQQKLVEQVQLGDREALIGQIDVLERLARDRRAEVRQTAIWALGRSSELTVAPILIKALSDADVVVNEEARNALCVLSRKPQGFKLPRRPLAGVADDAPQAERDAAIAKWRTETTNKWTEWYRSVQPYDQRDGLRLREEP
jgi:hypothetical protein